MILQGYRNKKDGLWDIHIPYEDVDQIIIQEYNYITPVSHAVMYILSSMSTITPSTHTTSTRPKVTPLPIFTTEFSGMEDLCDINDCNYWITQEKKEDRQDHTHRIESAK